jgi:hypothetical protein
MCADKILPVPVYGTAELRLLFDGLLERVPVAECVRDGDCANTACDFWDVKFSQCCCAGDSDDNLFLPFCADYVSLSAFQSVNPSARIQD